MTENQRRFPRNEIQIAVELSYLEEDVRTVTTRDISQGGLFMQLDNPEHYAMGEMVILNYNDPLQNNEQTSKDAVIVRHTDSGIAVAFIEMEEF